MKRILQKTGGRVLLCLILAGVLAGVVYAQGSAILPYITTFMRTLLDDADQGTARTTLGVGTGDSPVFVKTTLTGNEINIATAQTPASSTAAGTQGDVAWDTSYLYVAVATDTWKRTALSTWAAAENVIYAGENVIFAGEQVVYP